MYYQHITNAPGTAGNFAHRLGDAVPGMGGFNLEFLNSDHHIGTLRVGGMHSGSAGHQSYLLAFGDRDSGISGRETDPTRMTAKYFGLRATTLTVAGTANRRASTLAPIPRLAADELLVLRGFEMHTLEGNHNIRGVGVRHLRWRNAISVTFSDDSPDDDGFTFVIHYLVLLHASRTGRRRNPHFEGPFQQYFRFTESARIRKTHRGVAMLSGFTFRFADNDHHLRKIAIDLEPLDDFDVTFTDDERDNPVDGFIEYVLAIPYIR